MAANLSGMFAQLNNAIQNSPVEEAQGLLDMTSKGFGGAVGAVSGRDPYSFMNEGAKALQGEDDLAKVDMTTAKGMGEAANIYGKMGQNEQQIAMAQAGRALKLQQDEQLQEGAEEIKRNLDNKRLMQQAVKEGNFELARSVGAGAITAQEYYKQKTLSDLKIAEHLKMNPADPYEGAFTDDVMMKGREVAVRFNKKGEPIAILGEGRGDYQMSDVYNPVTGNSQPALVNKQDPSDIQFLGAGEPALSTFSIKETGDTFHIFENPPGGGVPRIVAQYDTLTAAEKAQKEATADMRSVNLLATIDEAINLIDDDDVWVGGLKGWALKYIPGTPAVEFEALVTSVKSNVGFEELRTLKAEGGSLGQVSNIENILLQSAIRSLDTAQSPEAIRRGLQTIKEIKVRLQHASKGGQEAADRMFLAERDANGQPTGRRLYKINNQSIAVLNEKGEYVGLETAQ